MQPRSTHCQLCGRCSSYLTKHHLIPRTRHGNKRSRRVFTREDMLERLLWLCKACHKQIHVLFTEKQLADQYNSREALLNHEEVQRFVQWIANKPADFTPRANSKRRTKLLGKPPSISVSRKI